MEIIQHTLTAFLQVAQLIVEELEQGLDYPRFQLNLQDILNELGRNICREVLESADEYVRQHKEERKD